jgi:hypothetical protein
MAEARGRSEAIWHRMARRYQLMREVDGLIVALDLLLTLRRLDTESVLAETPDGDLTDRDERACRVRLPRLTLARRHAAIVLRRPRPRTRRLWPSRVARIAVAFAFMKREGLINRRALLAREMEKLDTLIADLVGAQEAEGDDEATANRATMLRSMQAQQANAAARVSEVEAQLADSPPEADA